MTTMNASDARKAFEALAAKVGPKASFSIYLNTSRYGQRETEALSATLYATESYSTGSLFNVKANSWESLLSAADAAWDQHCDEHKRRTVIDMALAIIRMTDAHGHCSDQMMRVEFSPGDVKRFGADACAKANEMAGRGPFLIVETIGANAKAA